MSEKVNEYEAKLPLNEEEDKLYMTTKGELEEKQLQRISGVMFRSKANWYELGEKGSKYFFALEKAKYNYKTCYKIIDENQQEIVDPQRILSNQKSFYQNLYEVDEDVQFNMENSFGIRVPDKIREQQDTTITCEEVQEAIKSMMNNKTPGEDGLPIDFYKVFWTKLKTIFMEMMDECYTTNHLGTTARRGILNLIPKPGKDTRKKKT